MTGKLTTLDELVTEVLGDAVVSRLQAHGQLTLEIPRERLLDVCRRLRDDWRFSFEQLIDLCGVDYLTWGEPDAGETVPKDRRQDDRHSGRRFAVVLHLLSVRHNRRLRLRVFLDEAAPRVDSVTPIWPSANWFEREAFDLFGLMFDGHPDLRRILTDYGFIGHPFRKDFPLSGRVEVRYDPEKKRVVYQPVSIEPRVLVKRVIREEGFGARDS